jgi:hypothetical protein
MPRLAVQVGRWQVVRAGPPRQCAEMQAAQAAGRAAGMTPPHASASPPSTAAARKDKKASNQARGRTQWRPRLQGPAGRGERDEGLSRASAAGVALREVLGCPGRQLIGVENLQVVPRGCDRLHPSRNRCFDDEL